MTCQVAGCFRMGGMVGFTGKPPDGLSSIPWSITFSIASLGAPGFYVVNDASDVPPLIAPPTNPYSIFLPSVPGGFPATDLLHTFSIEYDSSAADVVSNLYDFYAYRFVDWIPEVTDAPVQNYQLGFTLHCDKYFTRFPDLIFNLNAYSQNHAPGGSYGNWAFNNARLEYWWGSGTWYGTSDREDYSYSNTQHTNVTEWNILGNNIVQMIIEQN